MARFRTGRCGCVRVADDGLSGSDMFSSWGARQDGQYLYGKSAATAVHAGGAMNELLYSSTLRTCL
jgi:hypothetical protein